MRARLLFKITIPLFFLLVPLLVLLTKPANVHAQPATVSCFIAYVNFNGSDQPPTTTIPTNTDFNLKITCTSFMSARDVSVTFNGVTKTLNGLTAALNTSFGPWNFPRANSGGITITIPSETVTCTSTCTVYMNEGPVATPLPTPPHECAYLRFYQPDPPVKGQPFTIVIKNPSSGSYIANVGYFDIFWYKPSLNQSGTKLLFGEPGTTRDWTANFSDVNEEFLWNVDFQGQQCGDTHDLFGSGSTSTGKNPCIDTNGDGKVDTCPTAIGNIPTNLGDFASAVLRIALGISGGIVLILMVIGSIRVMTSSGDPQRVAAGRDMIVAAIAGALFIAFSVMIMQFLGTAIVPIPGLTFNY